MKLEIVNRTPFPIVRAHLAEIGDGGASARRTLLGEALATDQGQLVEDVPAGAAVVVCELAVPEAEARHGDVARSARIELRAGEALTARVQYDPATGFRVDVRDARVVATAGKGPAAPTGRYTWTPTPGRHVKA
jgi:hypothetical protein